MSQMYGTQPILPDVAAMIAKGDTRDGMTIGYSNLQATRPHLEIKISPFRNGIDVVQVETIGSGGSFKHFPFMNGDGVNALQRAVTKVYEYSQGFNEGRMSANADRLPLMPYNSLGHPHKIFAGTGGGIISEICKILDADFQA